MTDNPGFGICHSTIIVILDVNAVIFDGEDLTVPNHHEEYAKASKIVIVVVSHL